MSSPADSPNPPSSPGPAYRVKVEQYLATSEVARTVEQVVRATYPARDLECPVRLERRLASVREYLERRAAGGHLFGKKASNGKTYWSDREALVDLTCSERFRTPLRDLIRGLKVTQPPQRFYRG